jgi:hypothetical protein
VALLLDCVRCPVREQVPPWLGRRLVLVAGEVDPTPDGEGARMQEIGGAVCVSIVVDRDPRKVVTARVRQLFAQVLEQGTGCAARSNRAPAAC